MDWTLCCGDEGDWGQSLTALVKHIDRSLTLVRWQPSASVDSATALRANGKQETA
jgi:hypothetical protein